MNRFTNTPAIEELVSGKQRTTDGVRFYLGYYESDIWVDVPAGTETDGLTLPGWLFWLRWLLPVWGKYGNAVLVHDYLVTQKGYITDHGRQYSPERERADYIFNEAMRVLEVNKHKRRIMYWAVCKYTAYLRAAGELK